jgi:hypothetical protein
MKRQIFTTSAAGTRNGGLREAGGFWSGFRVLNVRATERLVQRRAGKLPPKRRPRDADTVALERELGAILGLRVTLEVKKRGGALTLHYTSLDQLDRVLDLLRAPHPDSSPLGGLCILIASSTKTGSSRTKLSWSAA